MIGMSDHDNHAEESDQSIDGWQTNICHPPSLPAEPLVSTHMQDVFFSLKNPNFHHRHMTFGVVCTKFITILQCFLYLLCVFVSHLPHIDFLLTFLMLLIFHDNWLSIVLKPSLVVFSRVYIIYCLAIRGCQVSQIEVLEHLAHFSTCIIENNKLHI